MRVQIKRWFWWTSLGWVAGIVIVLALAGVGEAIMAGRSTQVIVGIGMALGVSLLQYRTAKAWFGASGWWVWASVIGMATPFLIGDLVADRIEALPNWLVILVQVLIGGFLSGLLQKGELIGHERAKHWPWFSALGWGLAACVLGVLRLIGLIDMDAIGNWGAVVVLIILLAGGPVLAIVTGRALAWIVQGQTVTS